MERGTSNGFDIKKLARTALIAAALAGCGGGVKVEPQKTTDPTLNSKPTELFVATPISTESALQTPAPIETQELSVDQQVRSVTLDYWLKLLDNTQKIPGGDSFYLKTSSNVSDWVHNKENIINGDISDSSLIVNWVGGEIYPDGNKYQGIKSQGVVFLEEINITTAEAGLTDPDKQAGISKVYIANLDFQYSFAENQFWPSKETNSANLSEVEKWIFQTEDTAFTQNGSNIEEANYKNLKVALKNGKWVFMGQKKFVENPAQLGDPLAGLSKVIPLMGSDTHCYPSGAYCQVFEQKITY